MTIRERLKALAENPWLDRLPEKEWSAFHRSLYKVERRLEEFYDRNNQGLPVDDEAYARRKSGEWDLEWDDGQ